MSNKQIDTCRPVWGNKSLWHMIILESMTQWLWRDYIRKDNFDSRDLRFESQWDKLGQMLVQVSERWSGRCLSIAASEICSHTLRSSALPCICIRLLELKVDWIKDFFISQMTESHYHFQNYHIQHGQSYYTGLNSEFSFS